MPARHSARPWSSGSRRRQLRDTSPRTGSHGLESGAVQCPGHRSEQCLSSATWIVYRNRRTWCRRNQQARSGCRPRYRRVFEKCRDRGRRRPRRHPFRWARCPPGLAGATRRCSSSSPVALPSDLPIWVDSHRLADHRCVRGRRHRRLTDRGLLRDHARHRPTPANQVEEVHGLVAHLPARNGNVIRGGNAMLVDGDLDRRVGRDAVVTCSRNGSTVRS